MVLFRIQPILNSLVFGAVLSISSAHAVTPMKISVDTVPSHVRNVWIEKFITRVKEKTGGEIEPQLFHSGQLYKDAQVPAALQQGAIDMAVPGTWLLGGLEKRMGVPGLPYFIGRSAEENYRFSDGPVGRELADIAAEKMNTIVLGRWIDNGHSFIFLGAKGADKVKTYKDFSGLKIRYPGGANLSIRFTQMGATPVLVPLPDVPLALMRGNFDGLISTADSMVALKLWESGLKAAYIDYGSFAQQVPFVNKNFWSKLSPVHQKAVREAWESIVVEQRRDSSQREEASLSTLAKNGVKLVRPGAVELKEFRDSQLAVQDEIVRQMGLDSAWVKSFIAAVDSAK